MKNKTIPFFISSRRRIKVIFISALVLFAGSIALPRNAAGQYPAPTQNGSGFLVLKAVRSDTSDNKDQEKITINLKESATGNLVRQIELKHANQIQLNFLKSGNYILQSSSQNDWHKFTFCLNNTSSTSGNYNFSLYDNQVQVCAFTDQIVSSPAERGQLLGFKALESETIFLNQVSSGNAENLAEPVLKTNDGSNEISQEITMTLRYGMKTSEVGVLQNKLQKEGLYAGKIDNIFGPKTLLAVRIFQIQNNLTPDGIVGPKTRAVLNSL